RYQDRLLAATPNSERPSVLRQLLRDQPTRPEPRAFWLARALRWLLSRLRFIVRVLRSVGLRLGP
ncbi:MAG TPA: hypothetical protein VLH75_01650, partial [Longimicrobiales bacterium]|nr:hypothetical protein [Longimicrobiales bacterium]